MKGKDMPLLDHFHPPLHGPRRLEGFHHAWANSIAHQLNQDVLPPDYFAEPEISVGPEMEVDVATLERGAGAKGAKGVTTAAWTAPRPKLAVAVDFSRLDTYEVRVYQDLGGAELRAAIELISPSNKDRAESRRTFVAKCAGHLQHGIGLIIIDVVTARSANLHEELFDTLEAKGRRAAWKSPTGLYAVAYRPVPVRKTPRVEAWPEPLTLGKALPVLPLWLAFNLYVPVRLEDSYLAACRSLRNSA
jgi:hypothetical protein